MGREYTEQVESETTAEYEKDNEGRFGGVVVWVARLLVGLGTGLRRLTTTADDVHAA